MGVIFIIDYSSNVTDYLTSRTLLMFGLMISDLLAEIINLQLFVTVTCSLIMNCINNGLKLMVTKIFSAHDDAQKMETFLCALRLSRLSTEIETDAVSVTVRNV